MTGGPSGVNVLLIAASDDGLPGAALLRCGGLSGAQYLINAPEGISRLCLEHKVRPGPNLRAITSFKHTGTDLAGLPGLILRLKQDGHKSLTVVGPEGTAAKLQGLQHIISWKHPQVSVSEGDGPSLNQSAYSDDTVEILGLSGQPNVWLPPKWLLQITGSKHDLQDVGTTTDKQQGQSQIQARQPCKPQGAESASSMSTSSKEAGTESSSLTSNVKKSIASSRQQRLGRGVEPQDPEDRFAALDKAFMASGGKSVAMAILAQKSKATVQEASSELPLKAVLKGHGGKEVIENRPTTPNTCLMAATRGGRFAAPRWGYLVHLKDTSQVLLAVSFDSVKAFQAAVQHPIMAYLSQCRVVAIIHFSPQSLTSSQAYQDLASSMPGKQVIGTSQKPELGFLASARLSVRLHHIAPELTILPHALLDEGRSEGSLEASANANERPLSWRCLRRIIIDQHGSIHIDDTQAVTLPDPGEIVGELLQSRPGLQEEIDARRAACKAVCVLTEQTTPKPLPAFPLKRKHALPQLAYQQTATKRQKQSSSAESLHRLTAAGNRPVGPGPQFQDFPNWPQTGTQAAMHHHGPMQASAFDCLRLPRPPSSSPPQGLTSASLPLWSFANVMENGRLLGTVQLTPQGWIGPPQAVQRMTTWPSQSTTACALPHFPDQTVQPILQHSSQVLPFSESADLARPNHIISPPLESRLRNRPNVPSYAREMPSNPGLGPSGEAATFKPWNKEDIDIADESDAETDASTGLSNEVTHTRAQGDGQLSEAEPSISKPESRAASPSRTAADSQSTMQRLRAQEDKTCFIVLGTGCAEPSKYRAASGILLQLHNRRNILMDAGEGTFGQLIRFFGPLGAQTQVDNLAMIFISHRHADHSTGLPTILQARSKGKAPLLVLCPQSCIRWLQEAFPHLLKCNRICHFNELLAPSATASRWLDCHLGLESVLPVPVRHCSDAYGLKLVHKDGWSLCYSGDTRPCKAIVDAAQGCTLLIHEATYASELAHMALQKKHSTVEEAVSVASQAQVQYCLLTHFSQRYGKLPCLPDGNRLVAYDGMRLGLTQLPDVLDTHEVFKHALSESKEVVESFKAKQPEPVFEQTPPQADTRVLPSHIRFSD